MLDLLFFLSFGVGFVVAAVAGLVSRSARPSPEEPPEDPAGEGIDGGPAAPFPHVLISTFLTSFGAGGLLANALFKVSGTLAILFGLSCGVILTAAARSLLSRIAPRPD